MRCPHIGLLGYAAKNNKPQFDVRIHYHSECLERSGMMGGYLLVDVHSTESRAICCRRSLKCVTNLTRSDAPLQYRPQVLRLCPPHYSIIRLGYGIFVDDIRLVRAVSTALGR